MQAKWKYIGLGVVVGIGVGAVIGGNLWAGLLEPPSSAVPEGTPTSTMRPLDELNGAWSQTLPCPEAAEGGYDPTICPRFELVINDEAVLDNETGLVWEQSPGSTLSDWPDAVESCWGTDVAGQFGWRLPTYPELLSLVDLNNLQGDPDLPPGHPFGNVTGFYWVTTTAHNINNFQGVFIVSFDEGGGLRASGKNGTGVTWCVRGGSGSQNPQ